MADDDALPDNVGTIIVELGRRGELTAEWRDQAVAAMLIARERFPDATLEIAVGGYDDDPRELWQIDEARAHVADVMRHVISSLDPPDFTKLNLGPTSDALVGVCIGAVHLVGRDPRTGAYLFKRRSDANAG